jgi:hypothetical protein
MGNVASKIQLTSLERVSVQKYEEMNQRIDLNMMVKHQ